MMTQNWCMVDSVIITPCSSLFFWLWSYFTPETGEPAVAPPNPTKKYHPPLLLLPLPLLVDCCVVSWSVYIKRARSRSIHDHYIPTIGAGTAGVWMAHVTHDEERPTNDDIIKFLREMKVLLLDLVFVSMT